MNNYNKCILIINLIFALSGSYETLEIEMKTCDVLAPNSMPKTNIRDENLTMAQTLARYHGYQALSCKNLYLMDYEKVLF